MVIARDEELRQFIPAEIRQGRGRERLRQFSEPHADRFDVEVENDGGDGCREHSDQHGGKAREQFAAAEDDRRRTETEQERVKVGFRQVSGAEFELFQEFRRQIGLEPEDLLELGREDHDRDAGGEAGHDRERHEFDESAHAE